jgi:hypothetical protein
MIKSRRRIWKGYLAWIWEVRNAYQILVGKQKEGDY